MAKSAVVRARVDESLIRALDAVTDDLPGDRSDHVRTAIENYIEAQRRRRQLVGTLRRVADAPPISLSRQSAGLSIGGENASMEVAR